MERIYLAVASEGGTVSQHFGHCREFMVFEVENDKTVFSKSIANMGHSGCSELPLLLKQNGVTHLIAGGIGAGAIQHLTLAGIDVIYGASGIVEDVVNAFASGSIKTEGSICSEHSRDGGCHNH